MIYDTTNADVRRTCSIGRWQVPTLVCRRRVAYLFAVRPSCDPMVPCRVAHRPGLLFVLRRNHFSVSERVNFLGLLKELVDWTSSCTLIF